MTLLMSAPAPSQPDPVPPDAELWRQVKRTVHGVPVGDDQIRMIIDAIADGLALNADDHVLDLACGNGGLSRYLFDRIAGLYGCDLSESLIAVARRYFAAPPRFEFTLTDVVTCVNGVDAPQRFTKMLCYGSFSYFSPDEAVAVLDGLSRRFPRVTHAYLGNLPDKDCAERFFPPGEAQRQVLDDHRTAIGVWRTTAEMTRLAETCGWRARFHQMPAGFYAAHYRYDVVLERLR
jgi:hypothetical protein